MPDNSAHRASPAASSAGPAPASPSPAANATGTTPARSGPRRVQPDTLNVAPALLDLPLASPSRRAGAMALDLAAVTLLSSLANGWLLAGLAVLLLRRLRAETRPAATPPAATPPAATPPATTPPATTPPTTALPWRLLAGALLLAGLWQGIAHWGHGGHDTDAGDDSGTAQVEAAVESAVESLRAGASWPQAVASAAESARPARAASSAPAARATLEAKEAKDAKDAPEAQAPTPAASAAPAGPEISAREAGYRAAAVALEHQVDSLQKELARARSETPWDRARRLLAELGLGYGGALLYFTLLPLVWPGQTPGKRLLGLRVVELTGAPMTAMLALRRYGGYAAGLATGGLGLLQLLWDRNRQAIQDRCAHTVVVDLRGR